jgi:hypothetical protein
VAATATGLQPLARFFQLATTQIVLLSYLDASKFFAVVFLLLLPLLLLVKPGTASGDGPA